MAGACQWPGIIENYLMDKTAENECHNAESIVIHARQIVERNDLCV